MIILNEAYFSKTKDLDDAFNQFCKLRHKYIGESGITNSAYLVNTDEEGFTFNRKMEKAFGFSSFMIRIQPNIVTNAFTFGNSYALDNLNSQKNLTASKTDGFKYTKGTNSCVVFLTSAGFMNNKFTDRELFAAILHEVGHVFENSLTPATAGLDFIQACLMIYLTIISDIMTMNPKILGDLANIALGSKAPREVYINIVEHFSKNCSGLVNFLNGIQNFLQLISGGVQQGILFLVILATPLYVIRQLLMAWIKFINPFNWLINIRGYQSERMADSFATIYGYGPDLASFLLKVEDEQYGIIKEKLIDRHIPLLGNIIDLQIYGIDLITHGNDVHPTTISRVNQSLKLLQIEIKKDDIDPKTKKEIMKQIVQLETLMRESTEVTAKFNESPSKFRNVYKKILMNLYGGDSRTIWGTDTQYRDIDNALQDVLNN